jgi:Asp-tRNA(Asn)/Glu-tRNA(Gln) amidotransferase A subunit family amidase
MILFFRTRIVGGSSGGEGCIVASAASIFGIGILNKFLIN